MPFYERLYQLNRVCGCYSQHILGAFLEFFSYNFNSNRLIILFKKQLQRFIDCTSTKKAANCSPFILGYIFYCLNVLKRFVKPVAMLVAVAEVLDTVDDMPLNPVMLSNELTVVIELAGVTNPLEPATRPAANADL